MALTNGGPGNATTPLTLYMFRTSFAYGDYGYGIFLLDEKSRDYVLKNIQNEKDPFLRAMMWGALWDSVREGELDLVRKTEPERMQRLDEDALLDLCASANVDPAAWQREIRRDRPLPGREA